MIRTPLSSRSFRGRNPPASLKPGGFRSRRHRGATFPGEKSSGLIEAFVVSHSRFQWLMFPGEKSSGLIEAIVSVSTWQQTLRCFRGRNPPASLKHMAYLLAHTTLNGVSGGEILRPH